MSDREINIVIRAQDEFSEVMERASSGAESSASRIRRALESSGENESAGLKDYITSVQKAQAVEAAWTEQKKRLQAENELDRLESESPYNAQSNGPQKIYLEYQDRLAALQSYNTAVIQEMIKAGRSQAEIEAAYTDLSIEYAGKRSDFQVYAAAQSAGAISNTLQNLYITTGSQNRALFEAMKAFAIAETTIKTYQGAMEAYSALAGIPIVGPALGAAAAAAVVAAGAARVAQIRSTSIGGGSSISSEGSADPSYSGGSFDAYPAPTTLSSDSKASQEVTINIYNPLSDQNWQKMVEDNIIPAINDAADRNISVTVKSM